ncbi:MAG: RidA family protein [Nocardioidaceae bacterium]
MTTPVLLRPVVRAAGWLAVSGQLGVRDGQLTGGVSDQTAQALANLGATLAGHGAVLADVVKVNVFLTGMGDYDAMNREYVAVFDADPPARTAVAVSELPFGAAVEIEAWAYCADL